MKHVDMRVEHNVSGGLWGQWFILKVVFSHCTGLGVARRIHASQSMFDFIYS